jgi:hypothetical protein
MKRILVGVLAASMLALGAPAAAAAPASIASFSVSSSTLVFTASTMSSTALTSAPLTATGSITYTTTTGGGGGTITITPGPISDGTSTVSAANFKLTCLNTGGNSGLVATANATPVKTSGSTACATLDAGKTTVTSTFSIQLTVNDTATAATPFGAGTYSGTITVTATAS